MQTRFHPKVKFCVHQYRGGFQSLQPALPSKLKDRSLLPACPVRTINSRKMAESTEPQPNQTAAEAADAVKAEGTPEGVEENDVLEEDDDFEEFEDNGA